MSLENALEKLADAILAHAEAVKLAATRSVTIDTKIDASAAIAAVKDAAKSADSKSSEGEVKDIADRTIYWSNEDGTYGKCSSAEYKKMTKAGSGYSVISSDEFKERAEAAKALQKENQAKAQAKAQEKEAEEAKAKAEAEARAKAEEEAIADDDPTAGLDDDPTGEATDEPADLPVPTKDEYTAAWQRFLKIDDAAVRGKRLAWTKVLLTHFGAPKATEIDEEHWGLVFKLVSDGTDGDLPDLDEALA